MVGVDYDGTARRLHIPERFRGSCVVAQAIASARTVHPHLTFQGTAVGQQDADRAVSQEYLKNVQDAASIQTKTMH